MPDLSWKPIRTGEIYCAPACGMGCTSLAHLKATNDAEALAKYLGKGWKTRIWENLGWHYSVISPCGRMKIHPFICNGKINSYTAFLGDADVVASGRWVENAKTPDKAIEEVLKTARADQNEINSFLEGF